VGRAKGRVDVRELHGFLTAPDPVPRIGIEVAEEQKDTEDEPEGCFANQGDAPLCIARQERLSRRKPPAPNEPTHKEYGQESQRAPDCPEREEVEARAEPNEIAGCDETQDTRKCPAAIGKAAEDDSSPRQSGEVKHDEQDDPGGERCPGVPRYACAPACIIHNRQIPSWFIQRQRLAAWLSSWLSLRHSRGCE